MKEQAWFKNELALSSCGGLEVERLLHKVLDSISVGLNLARRQKYFRSNSNTTGGALFKHFTRNSTH